MINKEELIQEREAFSQLPEDDQKVLYPLIPVVRSCMLFGLDSNSIYALLKSEYPESTEALEALMKIP